MTLSFDSFWRGIVIGFSIAAPVGPIGVLCIKRTLNDGRLSGFLSGLGAALADAAYGLLAVSGLTAVTGALIESRLWLQLFGGAFMLYLGLKTLLTKSQLDPNAAAPAAIDGVGLGKAFASTFILTISNPMTILSFVAIFAALGNSSATFEPLSIVAGVFLGSALWWLLLSGLVGGLRSRLDARALSCTNIISGIVITAFGGWALLSALTKWADCLSERRL